MMFPIQRCNVSTAALIALALAASPAAAQKLPIPTCAGLCTVRQATRVPPLVAENRGERITGNAPDATLRLIIIDYAGGNTLAQIDQDEAVFIDWAEVERWAAKPYSANSMLVSTARLMLATRDGTWRPLKP